MIYAAELAVTGAACFAAAKLDAGVGRLYSTSVPISLAAGVALAAVLLRGFRMWPAVLFAGFAAAVPVTFDDFDVASLTPALVAAAPGALARTLEAVLGRALTRLWSPPASVFDNAGAVLKFVASVVPAVMLATALGVAGMVLLGAAEWLEFVPRWAAWTLRDGAGAVVVASALVLWGEGDPRRGGLRNVLASAAALVAACAAGAFAFSPLIERGADAGPLEFVCLLPLGWAVLRCSRRDTATVALILAAFAAWGALAGTPPFARAATNASFVALIVFAVSACVIALAASAELSARERAADRMHRQAENLRALFAAAPVGLAYADAGGRFTAVNEQFGRILRRPAAELASLRLQDVLQLDDLPGALRSEHGPGGRPAVAVEASYTRPGGTLARLSTSVVAMREAAADRFVVATQDVTAVRRAEDEARRVQEQLKHLLARSTEALEDNNAVLGAEIENRKRIEAMLAAQIDEQRKVEEALAESERRFRLFVDSVHDCAVILLDADGRVAEWNAGAHRIHGYGAAEIVGQHFGRFYPEAEQQRGTPARALHAAAYEGTYLGEGWRVRRDETRLWASIAIEAIRDEGGGLIGFAHVTRDITERREAQQSLERAQQQLAQSQKMEALGQLTGSIAHDFNNLLMIVSGHAQLLRRRLSDPKHLQAVNAVQTAANRGESLTRQLLAFSRRQPLNPVVINPQERIEAVREMLAGSLRGNIDLRCDIPDDIWRIEVDVAELELAFVNLVVNARDATPGGGRITLTAKNVTLTEGDAVDQLEGDFVAITLTDTGVGIAPDVLPRIFEPFYTTKEFGKGTGLGLSQVYGFSHQSGGTVAAASTVGSGTAITIYLPRTHAEMVENAKAPAAPADVLAHGTILVVEDNADVADVTAALIEQLGYHAVRAENASQALHQLRQGGRIDLVLSDVVMPGSMNGFALAQEIRKRHADVPVLLTSGYNDVVQAATPSVPVLRKPFQLSVLSKAIGDALESGPTEPAGRVLPFAQARAPATGPTSWVG